MSRIFHLMSKSRRYVVLFGGLFSLSLGAAIAAGSESEMQAHYEEAYRLQAAGDLAQADVQYKLFLGEALHRVANSRANMGEYARAVPPYEEALTFTPHDFSLHLDYAGAALEAKDLLKARFLAEDALKAARGSGTARQAANAHRMLGQALQRMLKYRDAIPQFEAAVAIDPSLLNLYVLGSGYLLLPDKQNATRIFGEILVKFGASAAIHMDLGRAYGEAGYPDEAIQEFKKAIAKNDKLPGAHYSLGASYINKSGESGFSQAEPEFQKELAIQPNDSFTYPQLGRIALSRHELREAKIDLERAIELKPKNPDTLFLLGELYGELDRVPAAIAALRKSIALTKDPSWNHFEVQRVHYRLGRLLMDHGDIAEGKEEMRISEALLSQKRRGDEAHMVGEVTMEAPLLTTHAAKPADVKAAAAFEKQIGPLIAACYSNLGVNAAVSRNYADATTYFERAAEWNPSLQGLDNNWGRAAFAAHRYGEARDPLSRSLKAHPEDAELRSMLALTEAMLGDHSKAAELDPDKQH